MWHVRINVLFSGGRSKACLSLTTISLTFFCCLFNEDKTTKPSASVSPLKCNVLWCVSHEFYLLIAAFGAVISTILMCITSKAWRRYAWCYIGWWFYNFSVKTNEAANLYLLGGKMKKKKSLMLMAKRRRHWRHFFAMVSRIKAINAFLLLLD